MYIISNSISKWSIEDHLRIFSKWLFRPLWTPRFHWKISKRYFMHFTSTLKIFVISHKILNQSGLQYKIICLRHHNWIWCSMPGSIIGREIYKNVQFEMTCLTHITPIAGMHKWIWWYVYAVIFLDKGNNPHNYVILVFEVQYINFWLLNLITKFDLNPPIYFLWCIYSWFASILLNNCYLCTCILFALSSNPWWGGIGLFFK